MTIKLKLQEIKKGLKNDGEVKIGDYRITLDGNEAEITKNNKYLFTTTNWYEIEDFLIEEILNV